MTWLLLFFLALLAVISAKMFQMQASHLCEMRDRVTDIRQRIERLEMSRQAEVDEFKQQIAEAERIVQTLEQRVIPRKGELRA